MMAVTDGERLEHRRRDEIHDCVVLGCGERARAAYLAAADGELAGFAWRTGDFIDLCWPHASLLYEGHDPMWGAQ
jgi:hypothetical protein